jgi:YrbI family 3-deoxy-D-manno-octulosonate 8-phosphate phosphatase
VLLVIPARGGSKGIPRKNLAEVGGVPLVARAIKAARAAKLVHDVVVSTDDAEIADVSRAFDAEVIIRPPAISGDAASSESALIHAVDYRADAGWPADIVVLLQCTAPFTTARDIDGTIEPVLHQQAESCFAAAAFHHFVWERQHSGAAVGSNHPGGERKRRQDMSPQFLEAGSVYAMSVDALRKEGHRFCGRTVIHEVEGSHVFEIDTPVELRHAQIIARDLDHADPGSRLPNPIRAIVFDFDGVFTDNMVCVHQDGTESVRCSRSDGMGIEMLRHAGIPMLVLSKERNPVVEARCRKLKVPVIQGVDDKLNALKQWLVEQNVDATNTIYVGNDINDLECLEFVACGIGPADSHPGILKSLDIVLPPVGGSGAIRALCDLVLNSYSP